MVMRTFYRNAPIIIGAGALLVLLSAPAPLSLIAEEPLRTGSVSIDAESAAQPAGFVELRAQARRHRSRCGFECAQSGPERAWRRRQPVMAAPVPRADRSDQGGLGVPRRRGPGLPPCQLFALARHLCQARSRALPAVKPTASGRSPANRQKPALFGPRSSLRRNAFRPASPRSIKPRHHQSWRVNGRSGQADGGKARDRARRRQ